MKLIIDNSPQGTPEWKLARAGVVTASNFHKVLMVTPEKWLVLRPSGTTAATFYNKKEAAEQLSVMAAKSKMKGEWDIEHVPVESLKTRNDYMLQIATEIITGRPVTEDAKSHWMERGNEIEDQARAYYELKHPAYDVRTTGLIYLNNRKRIGASLDSFVNDDGVNEIKCPKLTTHITYLRENQVPTKYVAQVQGQLWVAKRDWNDFESFHPDSHIPGFFFRAERNEAYIKSLKKSVYQFIKETDVLVEELKTLTARKAA